MISIRLNFKLQYRKNITQLCIVYYNIHITHCLNFIINPSLTQAIENCDFLLTLQKCFKYNIIFNVCHNQQRFDLVKSSKIHLQNFVGAKMVYWVVVGQMVPSANIKDQFLENFLFFPDVQCTPLKHPRTKYYE